MKVVIQHIIHLVVLNILIFVVNSGPTNEPIKLTKENTTTTPIPKVFNERPNTSYKPLIQPTSTSFPQGQQGYHGHKQHQATVANAVIRSLLSQTYQNQRNDRARMVLAPREISYHDGETIATIYTDSNGNITKCNLFEIKRIEDSERILAQFAKEKRPVQKINFRTMLSVITACQAIDPVFAAIGASLNNSIQYHQERPIPPNQLDVLSMRTVISGILPGTKWCGLGDIAQDYEDLGKEKDLDKCCRAHDHCPTKLRSFRSGYGLINWSLYTKSHCECDSLLYECLKGAASPTSELLGNFYFNVLQVQCIDEEDPVKCLARDKTGSICRIWAPDPGSGKRMVFRDVRRQF